MRVRAEIGESVRTLLEDVVVWIRVAAAEGESSLCQAEFGPILKKEVV